MAKSYRRILRLPHRQTLAAWCVAWSVCFTAGVRAQTPEGTGDGWSRDRIEALAARLRSDRGEERARTIEALLHLPEEALGAIRARVEYTRRQIVPGEDGLEALRSFRHATGSRRADDMVDIATGIEAVLEERRDDITARSAERVLLIRSLEGIGTLDAQRSIADIFSLTNEMWRWEQRRILERMGGRILAGLIVARGHADRGVRRWAREATRTLNMENPAMALQEETASILQDRITAYAEVRDLDAMPVIISFVDHPDPGVRDAARAAMERYGRNGIWQLREAMQNTLGERADESWGWRRTMTALYSKLDERRLAPYAAQVDEARASFDAGDLPAARATLDQLLLDAPEPPRAADIAALYAEMSASVDAPVEARRLMQRAVWLGVEHPHVGQWRAQLVRMDAEVDQARGLVDPTALGIERPQDASVASAEATHENGVESNGGGYVWLLALLGLVGLGVIGWRTGYIHTAARMAGVRLPRWRLPRVPMGSVRVAARSLLSKLRPTPRRSARTKFIRPTTCDDAGSEAKVSPKVRKKAEPVGAAFVFGAEPAKTKPTRTPETASRHADDEVLPRNTDLGGLILGEPDRVDTPQTPPEACAPADEKKRRRKKPLRGRAAIGRRSSVGQDAPMRLDAWIQGAGHAPEHAPDTLPDPADTGERTLQDAPFP